MAPSISLVIPTQRRLRPLETAVRSALAQAGVDAAGLELVVVDNDTRPSAKRMVEQFAADAPFPVIYVHEPRPGVANARNAAMERARGDLIAFLDDDEEAPPHWLSSLVEVQQRCDADVVFGPVRARAPDNVRRHRAYLEWFFSRKDPACAGLIDHYYGCGDSLLRRAALADPLRPFSPARNQSGGEDDLLFGAMQREGRRFAWAPEAWVWEDPAPERLSLRYALARAFVYGQGPVAHCAAAIPPDRLGIIRWMLIGAGQALVYGAVALVLWILRRPDRAFMMDRAARGLGKLFWGKRFRINFYGRTVPDNAGQEQSLSS